MASDSQDSRRKHRRSASDEESPEDSKRQKHRHHHRRRHHHRHRHGSKKHDEERKDGIQVESKGEVEEVRKIVPSAADYDMEEGEIIEEEEIVVADTEIADKKVESDVESGEFKAHEGRSEFDDSYTRDVTDMVSPGTNQSLPAADNDWTCGKNLKSTRSDGSKKHGSHYHYDESPMLESIVNGDYDNRSSKLESMSHTRCKSPSKECNEQNVHCETESKQQCLDLMKMGEDEYAERRNSSSHNVREDRHKALSRSPSHGSYHMETSCRPRSASSDRMREREHSQSILYDEHPRMRHRHERDERLYDNGKVHDELDGERGNGRSTYHRFGSRDIADDRRDYRSRMRESKDERGDYSDREREEKRYKDKKRDNDCDKVLEKERIRSRGGDLDWDTKQDRERRRDKDLGRSRDRDLDREQRRDNSIGAYRDRDIERERANRLSNKDRKLEMDNGRDRNSARDRHRDKIRVAESDRSRRYHKYYDDGYGNRDRRHGYDEAKYRRDRDRKCNSGKNRGLKDDSLKENYDGLNRDEDDQKDYQEKVGLELAEHEEDDTDRIKEESRKLREAILQKYKAQQPHREATLQNAKASKEEVGKQSPKNVVMTVAAQEKVEIKGNGQDSFTVETSFDLGKSTLKNDATAVVKSSGALGLGEGTPKSERSNDMFRDDIFGDSPAGVCKTSKGDGLPVERSGLHDNWDDPEGYYSFRFGEILDCRYEITAAHGKGVFSTVVRAKDLKAGAGDLEEVAIKIIRNNETMLKAGTEELVILKKLVGADPDDRRHCVRYLSNFKYRNHLCIVFESLNMNLREVLKKFGRNIGLKLTAVRAYAKQLFIALKHLRNCGVLHCDIKPDNMLVNDAKNVLKLCDFGSAMFAGKNEITPYLVSRFYRAPEIILGLPYDHPVDMWSVGCCLYELYIGKVLFPGLTNNDMLRLHIELKGPFPKKMLRKGAFVEQYFDPNMNFLAIEEDPVTKKPIRRPIINIKPKDISTIIKGSPGEDPKMLANFKDLLDKIFALDPEKRLTVSQALNHSFITGK